MCPIVYDIAKALDVPTNVILNKAGILDVESKYNDMVSKIAYKTRLLTKKAVEAAKDR